MRQSLRFRERPSSEAHIRGRIPHFTHELKLVADSLHLSREVRKRADSIGADAAGMHFGRATDGTTLAAAALYVACREHKVPVTLRELAEASGTDPRDLGRRYGMILERMHISRPRLSGVGYVRRLALGRRLSAEVYELAEATVAKTTEAGFGGRNPMTLAAAALYLACCSLGENATQAEVAEAAGVGEESVRECCKVIRSLAGP